MEFFWLAVLGWLAYRAYRNGKHIASQTAYRIGRRDARRTVKRRRHH